MAAQLEELRVRFSDEATRGAEAAAAALAKLGDAGEKATAAVRETDEQVKRAGSSAEQLARKYIEAERATAAKEQAERKHARALADVEAQQRAGAISAQRAAEMRSAIARQAEVDAARIVAAAERRAAAEARLLGGAGTPAQMSALAQANDNVASSGSRVGAALGQAGFQIQDFATQVAMGQNILIAASTQFAQFAGMFGVGGAIAGAAVTVGVIGAQFLGLAGSTDTLSEAIKTADENFRRLDDGAGRRVKAYQEEAEAVARLAAEYTAMGVAGQRAETLMMNRNATALSLEGGRMRDAVQGALSRREMGRLYPRDAYNDNGEAMGLAVPDERLAALRDAMESINLRAGSTAQALREVIAEADRLGTSSDTGAASFRRMRDAAMDLLPAAASLDSAHRNLAVQTLAMMQAQGESEAAMRRYAAQFGEVGAAIMSAARALAALRAQAVDDPFAGANAEIARLNQQLAALDRGGLEAYRRVLTEQERQAEITRRATREQEAFTRALEAQQVPADEARRRAEELGPSFVASARTAVDAAQRVTTRVQQLEEATRNAGRAARDAGEAYGALRTGTAGLLSLGGPDERAIQEIQRAMAPARRDREAAERAAREIEQEQRRSLERQERAWDQTTDRVTSRLADELIQAFKTGEGGAEAFFRRLRSLAANTALRLTVEALVRPVVASGVSYLGGVMGGAGAGGAAGGVNLGGAMPIFSGGMSSTGIGAVDSALNYPLFRLPFGSAAGPQHLGDLGVYAPSADLNMPIGGGPSFTVGNALGAAGYGFNAYQGFQRGGTGGTIQGIGNTAAAAMMFIPGMQPFAPFVAIGSSILGSALGGRDGHKGGDALIQVNSAGMLEMDRYAGKGLSGEQQQQLMQQAGREIAEVNAAMKGAGLRIKAEKSELDWLTRIGAGDSPQPRSLMEALGNAGGASLFDSSNDNVRRALAAKPNDTAQQALETATWVTSVYEALVVTRTPAEQLEAALKTIAEQMDAARKRAEELGLSTDGMAAAQERANRAAEQQVYGAARASAAQAIGGVADFVRGLRGSDFNPSAPRDRLYQAENQFWDDFQAARRGDASAFGRIQSSAQSLLSLSREVDGSGAASVARFDRVVGQLGELGMMSEDRLTAGFMEALSKDSTATLQEELARLRSEVAGLRRDVAQRNASPLAA